MVYLFAFLLTSVLTYIYEHSWKKSNRFSLLCLEVIIILVPSLLGGFRAITVGTDNLNYFALFRSASRHGFFDFLIDGEEKGFSVLVWILAHLGKKYFIFAFTTSLITFTLIFKSIKYYKDRFSMTIMIIVYLFIYYCAMYNYVRQGIALAIVFFAYRYAEEKKYIFFVMIAIACTIHISAIISILIYIAFYFKEKMQFNRYIFLVIAIIVALIISGPDLVYNLLVEFASLGIRTETILTYSRRFSYISKYSMAGVLMVRALPQLLVSTIFLNKIVKLDDHLKGYYILCWIQFFIMILGCAYEPFSRLSIYFNYSEFILLAAISKSQTNKKNRLIVNVGILSYCIMYWIIFTVLNYYGFKFPVYPYSTQ